MFKEKIQGLAKDFHKEIIEIRRHLHQYPELSCQEEETARFVAGKLEEWGIPYQSGVAGHGLVAMIEGREGGETVALRGDMDALPIVEANEVPYKSKHPGVMHACGHDVHTACLLGAAKILKRCSGDFKGRVKLIFQPAEEKLPGGASLMIQEGVLENPRPKAIFGQHVHPPLEVGKIGMKPGLYMASGDELYLTVEGKGGHGALPQDCVDPIVVSAYIITALQQVVSRKANPATPTVLTLGKIASVGGSTNVIPNAVELMGTFRTFDEDWREKAHGEMKRLAETVAEGMGARCSFEIRKGYPSLYNNPELAANARAWAEDYLGAENVVDLPLRMTAEDFAYFSQAMPAFFYRLGTGNAAKGITSPVHTDTFDVDEDCLRVGAGLMAWMAFNRLLAAG